MQVIRRLGNNAAVALDGNGRRVVILGKGVGFPAVPYELEDMSVVEMTFYDVDSHVLEMISSLPEEILGASADIVEQAQFNLDYEMNPNLTFTLADHLQYALERYHKGINIPTPLAYDVKHLYAEEYELGLLALDILEDYTKVRVPESEAVNIALHIVNGEIQNATTARSVLESINMIGEISDIIERELSITIDKNGFEYSRFVMHLRYLLLRLETGEQLSNHTYVLYRNMAKEYPEAYKSAQIISNYFVERKGWYCTNDEILYLMVHIIRLKEKLGSK